MSIEKDNENLIEFWNQALKIDEETKKEFKQYNEDDWTHLAPSLKLFDAASLLGKKKKVLDYGCGTAWASIIANKSGCLDVTAVDVIKDGVESAKLYAETFKANINALCVKPNWLENVESKAYDGIICSNVLDVVPLETSKYIIEQLARVATDDALIIFSFNFYLDNETASKRGMSFIDGNKLYINGVLRLLNLSDDEWKALFDPYFEVVKLDYFAWPNENKETRRLFILKKK